MDHLSTPSSSKFPANVKGFIAAGDRQTAEAGAHILRQGGNAIDAAVAAAFASFVAEMALVNIGGSGIALVHLPESGDSFTYDFFSDVPQQSYRPGISDFKEVLIDFEAYQQSFYIGRTSVAVPGAVAGLCALAQRYGSLALTVLLEPAIHLAQRGAVLSPLMAGVIDLLAPIFLDTSQSAAIYAPTGRPLQAGERLKNSQLAETLRALGQVGPDLFYQGRLAQQIITDQEQHGGLLTLPDLVNYQVRQDAVIRIPYRGYTVAFPMPASVGGVLSAFSLQLMAALDFSQVQFLGSKHIQMLAEVMRLTNIARKGLILTETGVRQFLSQAYLDSYQQELQAILAGASPSVEPTFLPGSSDTTQISVMDAQGNVVSLTTSAGEGAGFVVDDTGVTLNNMLGEIDLHPGGFHQSPPGQRLQTMMSPVIVFQGTRPVLAMGSGGSTRIRSAILQVISNLIDFEKTLTAAVEAPRIHFETDILQLEGGISGDIGAALADKGYQINQWPGKSVYFGGTHAVGSFGDDWAAVGDLRRGGVGLCVK